MAAFTGLSRTDNHNRSVVGVLLNRCLAMDEADGANMPCMRAAVRAVMYGSTMPQMDRSRPGRRMRWCSKLETRQTPIDRFGRYKQSSLLSPLLNMQNKV